jgi:hypothetical protein
LFGSLAGAKYSDGTFDLKIPDVLGNLKAKYEKKTGQYWLYEWNHTGMLTKVTRPDGNDVTFKYDEVGLGW